VPCGATIPSYSRWGPFFLPAYLLAALYLYLTGHDPYNDNPFERQAFAAESDEPPTEM
jgi:hypothetical protein